MFLDTSIIIEIFRHDKQSKLFNQIYDHIQEEPLYISVLQIGELSDWCLHNNIDPEKRIATLKPILNIVPLSEDLCIEGSKIKNALRTKGIQKFSLIDGIILASARSMNQPLLTRDTDFRKVKDATVI